MIRKLGFAVLLMLPCAVAFGQGAPTSTPIWVGPVTAGNCVKQQGAVVGGPLLTDTGAACGGGGGGSGTVTSIAIASTPTWLTVSGSPVTVAGTITLAAANQNANLFLAGPSSGGATAPAFRGLAISDIPATGTPSSTTYLRGDGTWSTPSSGTGSPGGSTGQMQYNNGGSFGGLASLTTTGSDIVITDASATALTIGANGATNPVAQFDSSATSVATGWKFSGAAAGSGATMALISSGPNEAGTYNLAKGSGFATVNGGNELILGVAAGPQVTISGGSFYLDPTPASTGSHFTYSGPADTALTASAERNGVLWGLAATRTWATGAIPTQREVRMTAPTYAFVGASTIAEAATFAIDGAPVAGTNATMTQTEALRVFGGTGVAGTAIAGYFVAPTGGSTNWAVLASGNINVTGNYYNGGTVGVTCAAGTPSASFQVAGGIVIHC